MVDRYTAEVRHFDHIIHDLEEEMDTLNQRLVQENARQQVLLARVAGLEQDMEHSTKTIESESGSLEYTLATFMMVCFDAYYIS